MNVQTGCLKPHPIYKHIFRILQVIILVSIDIF